MLLAPVNLEERYSSLDVIRGVALFGVLMGNLLMGFRVSIYHYYLVFHTDPGLASHAVDYLREIFISGKAMTLFTLLFGVGMAVQMDRARQSGRGVASFMLRRLFILLLMGFAHLLLLWEGDVLVLYAVCGIVALMFSRASATFLVCVAVLLLCIHVIPFTDFANAPPDEAYLRELVENHSGWIADATYLELIGYRLEMLPWFTLRDHMFAVLPTCGVMLLGMAAWRSGVLRNPGSHSRLLWSLIVGGALIGFAATAVIVQVRVTREYIGGWSWLCDLLAHLPLALAYGAALLLWLDRHPDPDGKCRTLFAAAGRMALTNYLLQSLIFTTLFYGYGFGLFNRLSSARVVPLGLLVFVCQLYFSRSWLRTHRFGPVEWLWRSLTYGRLQPMKLAPKGVQPV